MRSRGRSTEWIDGHKDGTDGLWQSDFMPKDDDVEPSEFNGNVVGGGLKNEREGKKKTAQLAVSERQRMPQPTAVKQMEVSKMLHLSHKVTCISKKGSKIPHPADRPGSLVPFRDTLTMVPFLKWAQVALCDIPPHSRVRAALSHLDFDEGGIAANQDT